MVPSSACESCTARLMIVASTVSRSREELTARSTSSSACSSATERVSSSVRACNSPSSRAFSIAITAWSGKGADQLYLPFGERLDPPPREIDRAEHGPLAQQRYSEHGASPGRRSLGQRVVGINADVLDMHDLAFEHHPRGDAVATRNNCSLAQDRPMLGLRCTVGARHTAVDLTLAYCDRSGIGGAKPRGRFHYCVQHRLHIGGRAADNVEHVAGRGLVFERF